MTQAAQLQVCGGFFATKSVNRCGDAHDRCCHAFPVTAGLISMRVASIESRLAARYVTPDQIPLQTR